MKTLVRPEMTEELKSLISVYRGKYGCSMWGPVWLHMGRMKFFVPATPNGGYLIKLALENGKLVAEKPQWTPEENALRRRDQWAKVY